MTTPPRPPTTRPRGHDLRAVLRRTWDQAAEDNVPFLAGGLAFNILLALVPFVLLLITGISFLLGSQPEAAARAVLGIVDRFLPQGGQTADRLLRDTVGDVFATRTAVTVYSAIGFAWFSTRLFGSLRSTLSLIFDGRDHGIVAGKLFDFAATLVSTAVVALYVVVTAMVDLATVRGGAMLQAVGLREDALGTASYLLGRVLTLGLVVGFFHLLYRALPRHRPAARTAFVGALTAGVLFEVARHLFARAVGALQPDSLYTGSIAAVVSVVFWTYYAAFLFLLGAEVTQAVALHGGARPWAAPRAPTPASRPPAA